MLKNAKWVEPSQADEPISLVAAQVIRERLEAVWKYAPLAAEHWDDEPENLHLMRVGTRRSAAALVTFAELLPKKKSRRMHKCLKRLRKVSGAARDLDVLVERLRHESESQDQDHARVLAKLYDLRSDAQLPIVKLIDDLEACDFPHQVDSLCKRIRWRGGEGEPSYAVQARRLIAQESDNFLAAVAENAADHHALHQLRIAGKQLRYSMEVLSGGLRQEFRGSLYDDLRELQDKLGMINDHAVAHRRIHQWSAEAEPKLVRLFETLAASEAKLAEAQREQFLNWWSGKRSRQFVKKLRQAIAPTEAT